MEYMISGLAVLVYHLLVLRKVNKNSEKNAAQARHWFALYRELKKKHEPDDPLPEAPEESA